ncbi:MAG: N-acetylmuramoyl-L-alanine amidase [Bacteroidales bacterium]|nr:N-acetylmuramoyl-L-alanine amidase [Bacteroidales bacterium]
MKNTILRIKYVWLLMLLLMFIADLAKAQDYIKVTPEKGEGAFALLRRYNLDPTDYFEAFIELNKNKLGEDLSLKTGQTYLLPVKAESTSSPDNETGVFPIFGKDYEKIEFKDNSLQGAIFYIISGHGGPDPGAIGKKSGHTLCEDEYAYDIALRLARNLLEHNATVYLITRDPNDGIRDERYLKCDKDENCWGDKNIPINQTRRLRQRVDAINAISKKYESSYQRSVELHVDSRYEKQNVDIFFYYHPNSKKGKALNETLYKTIREKYKEVQPNRGYKGSVSARNLYMIRHANPVSSYIELGNINHERDQRRLLEVDNRQAIANWLTLGLIIDYENSRK